MFQYPDMHPGDEIIDEDMLWGRDSLHEFSNGDRSDAKLSFEEICHKYGFAYEAHQVQTQDGYLLTVYRIPGLLQN